MDRSIDSHLPWEDIRRGILRDPLIAYGMTVRLAVREDVDEVTTLLPAIQGRSFLRQPELAARLVADGTLYLVRDDVHEPMGLVRIRDAGDGRSEVGWRLGEGRLGKGLSAFLIEGVTERLFRAGARAVDCPIGPAAHGARRVLQALGYKPIDLAGRPILHRVNPEGFAARPRRGITLLPTPAERRRGASSNEQGLLAREEEMRRAPKHVPGQPEAEDSQAHGMRRV